MSRSYDGCWTCKSMRRKCDTTRPACHNCQRRGVPCEGYEIRLRWGNGIASRGRFTGAQVPTAESIPQRAKGRKRERIRFSHPPHHESPEGSPSFSLSRNESDKSLFMDFLNSGVNLLHATTANNTHNLLPSRLPELCKQSECLFDVCVAFQASMEEATRPRFFDYFDTALTKFRTELDRSALYLEDSTLTAGLLLCSIGFMHCLPWSLHLNGMHNALNLHATRFHQTPLTNFRGHLIEVMGLMDLPTHSIGRKNPYIGIWKRYCSVNCQVGPADRSEVEIVSGLPRSLIDIYGAIGNGTSEQDFWNWSGALGGFLQCQLWEASRLAGMLSVRRFHSRLAITPSVSITSTSSPMTTDEAQSAPRQPFVQPSTIIIVSRILSSVDAIRRACLEPQERDTLIMNATRQPVFVAGLEVQVLNSKPEWKDMIRQLLSPVCLRNKFCMSSRNLLEILEELWERDSETLDVEELARGRGVELGLI